MTNLNVMDSQQKMTIKEPLIPASIIKSAVDAIRPSDCEKHLSRVVGVDWRTDTVQILVRWNSSDSLEVYIDFKGEDRSESYKNRDRVLKEAFSRFAPKGKKPFTDRWGYVRHDFMTNDFVSPNDITAIADELGLKYSVIFRSRCHKKILAEMGITWRVGTCGSEWFEGQYHPYTRSKDCNL